MARHDGVLLCPEDAATYAAYQLALERGKVDTDERVELLNCASGLKYPLPPVTRAVDRHHPVDYTALRSG